MPIRFKKKSGKYRGTRTCGAGSSKNRRGKGNKGGWGRAGIKKHRYTYATRYEPGKLGSGSHGFRRYNKRRLPTINVMDIEKQAGNGSYVFYGKVLGAGVITKPVEVSAFAFTKVAKNKIEGAGGKAVLLNTPLNSLDDKKSGNSKEKVNLGKDVKKDKEKNDVDVTKNKEGDNE